MTQIMKITFALMALVISFSSCKKVIGTGPIETETRDISGFTSINLSIDADVHITQDSVYYVEVMAQNNILDILRTNKSGNELCISYKPSTVVKSTEDVVLNIHMPTINGIEVSGSGSVNAAQSISTNTIDCNISGSGKINLNSMVAQQINTKISGSGKISINGGTTENMDCKISGSGDLYCSSLTAQHVNTQTSGSGTHKVYAVQMLDAEISGSGNVYYRGNPTVHSSISGSGKLIHEN